MIELVRHQEAQRKERPPEMETRQRFISIDPDKVEVIIENDEEDGYVTLMMASGNILDVIGDYRAIKQKIEAGRTVL